MKRSMYGACAILVTHLAIPALVQSYPSRAVRVIVPTAPGGPHRKEIHGTA